MIENISAVKGVEKVIFPSGTEFIIEKVNENKFKKFLFGNEYFKKIEIQITIPLYIKDWWNYVFSKNLVNNYIYFLIFIFLIIFFYILIFIYKNLFKIIVKIIFF